MKQNPESLPLFSFPRLCFLGSRPRVPQNRLRVFVFAYVFFFSTNRTLLQLPAPECAKGGSAAAPGHARVLRDGRRGVRGLPLPD